MAGIETKTPTPWKQKLELLGDIGSMAQLHVENPTFSSCLPRISPAIGPRRHGHSHGPMPETFPTCLRGQCQAAKPGSRRGHSKRPQRHTGTNTRRKGKSLAFLGRFWFLSPRSLGPDRRYDLSAEIASLRLHTHKHPRATWSWRDISLRHPYAIIAGISTSAIGPGQRATARSDGQTSLCKTRTPIRPKRSSSGACMRQGRNCGRPVAQHFGYPPPQFICA